MIISFDLDGTLDDEFDGSLNLQKEEIQGLARKYINEGHDVCILTKRYDADNKSLGKGNEYLVVFELARKIGINKIYFTNREMKFHHILKLKVDMHFENADYEVNLINKACEDNNHKCVVVPVEDKYWRDLVY